MNKYKTDTISVDLDQDVLAENDEEALEQAK